MKAVAKRQVDLVGAIVGLVVAAPVMLVIAVAIRIVMGRPVLIRQRRPGLREQPFTLYKFRTMTEATGQDGRLLPDADRLTPLGRLLRVTSLDELPELFNVLRGEMSLVGPRPLLERYLEHLTPRERTRHSIRPGITGLAQVSGRNHLDWDQRLALDARYVEHWSLTLDMTILARTLLQVLARRDVAAIATTVLPDLDDARRARTYSSGSRTDPPRASAGPDGSREQRHFGTERIEHVS